MRTFACILVLATVTCVVPSRAIAQHEHEHAHTVPDKLGDVRFSISCKPEVQPAFTRAVALLHSFAYEEAARAFADVAAKDPALCGGTVPTRAAVALTAK